MSAQEHDRFIADNKLSGGCFFSAKTGENVLVFFYKVCGIIPDTDFQLIVVF